MDWRSRTRRSALAPADDRAAGVHDLVRQIGDHMRLRRGCGRARCERHRGTMRRKNGSRPHRWHPAAHSPALGIIAAGDVHALHPACQARARLADGGATAANNGGGVVLLSVHVDSCVLGIRKVKWGPRGQRGSLTAQHLPGPRRPSLRGRASQPRAPAPHLPTNSLLRPAGLLLKAHGACAAPDTPTACAVPWPKPCCRIIRHTPVCRGQDPVGRTPHSGQPRSSWPRVAWSIRATADSTASSRRSSRDTCAASVCGWAWQ